MKDREVREALRGKVDPVLLSTLETLAEEMTEMKKVMVETVSLLNMTVDGMEAFEKIATNMKHKIETLGKEEENVDKGAMQ